MLTPNLDDRYSSVSLLQNRYDANALNSELTLRLLAVDNNLRSVVIDARDNPRTQLASFLQVQLC